MWLYLQGKRNSTGYCEWQLSYVVLLCYNIMVIHFCTIGCSEKFKNAKSNFGYSYFMTLWYIETEKTRFFLILRFFSLGVAASKFLCLLCKWKKNRSDYGVHGIQIDRLNLKVSTQKLVLKNTHRVFIYFQKTVQNWHSKPNQQNSKKFRRYLGTHGIFFKTDFCIETVRLSRSIWIPWTL